MLKINVKKKFTKTFCGKKSFIHTKTFLFCKMFSFIFFNIHKKINFIPIQKKLHKNMRVIKKKEIIDRKVFKL